ISHTPIKSNRSAYVRITDMNPPNRPDNHPAPTTDGTFKTDIVNNIPLHQAAPLPAAASEDDELDKIMRDVGHQLNQESHKPAKKHHLFGRKEPKKEPKFAAQPVPKNQPHQVPVHPVVPRLPQAAQSAARPASQVAKPRPMRKAKSSAPVM